MRVLVDHASAASGPARGLAAPSGTGPRDDLPPPTGLDDPEERPAGEVVARTVPLAGTSFISFHTSTEIPVPTCAIVLR
ncbi:hypothetical protein BCD48_17705 [Pseudofrankia sp. BMG5.36]|nr:hypothetical protein BCD48_17705 [Pseudofrankia sp. BMG5.36]